MGLSLISYKESVENFEKFKTLSTHISEMASQEDLKIIPYGDPRLIHFSKLEEQNKREVLGKLEILAEVCQDIQTKRERIRSAKTLTWAFLKHFQCVGPSDLLNHMQDTDFVDAYGSQHRMLFASLNFFELSSYTLEEFFCRSWIELFERPNLDVQTQLLSLSEEMLNGKYNSVVSSKQIPIHRINEKAVESGLSVEVEPQCFSPLYNRGEIIGYLCVNRARVLKNK